MTNVTPASDAQSEAHDDESTDADDDSWAKTSIWAALSSRYAIKLMLTLFVSILLFCAASTYYIQADLFEFDSLTLEMDAAVTVRYFIDTAMVNNFEVISSQATFRSKEDATVENKIAIESAMGYWNNLMFGDDTFALNKTFEGAAFRTKERQSLLFDKGCLRADNDCSDKNRFPLAEACENGELFSVFDHF
eukprot:TRINITY_DN1793_c2_g1_i4.p1 TRINITY_DN1793_c2_g1~~TRINITY_DN1793_c2_g1_i4.p1  ORF type:complete len:192 (-),score=58.39 TRINITY_DN1793_c2_g1_i4:21-596(-)